MEPPLLDIIALHNSTIVANCRMNRERQLGGSNGNATELQYDLKQWLWTLDRSHETRWLDVCCGSGIALIEAMEFLSLNTNDLLFSILGIDLAGHFVSHNFEPRLVLRKTAIEKWEPNIQYDLITCVHGLHYIGDKLGAIRKMLRCLSKRGVFLANIDLSNLQLDDGRGAGRAAVKRLRRHGVQYDSRRRLLKCTGGRKIGNLGLDYLGADDTAGPNYTGQPAVNSIYRSVADSSDAGR